MTKPIALAADHGGFELKEAVKAHLDELGLEYIDFGTHSTASVDYPDMALPACDAVVSGQCSKALLPDYHRLSPAERERAERLAAEAAAKNKKAEL